MKHLLGEKIGEGRKREVYNHKEDDNLVIKRAKEKKGFTGCQQNELEYRFYNDFPDKPFAPTYWITEDKKYLIQKKGKPAKKIPDHDLVGLDFHRLWNWVEIDGKTLLCDFAHYLPEVSIAIKAHPSRKKYAEALRDQLLKKPDKGLKFKEVKIVWDEKNSIWDTAKRAWLSYTGEYHCVIDDDAILGKDFNKRLLDAIRENRFVCMYIGGNHSDWVKKTKENKRKGGMYGSRVWGIGNCMPSCFIKEMIEFGENLNGRFREKRDDSRIRKFIRHKGFRVYYPLPTLVDHMPINSIRRKKVELKRRSPYFQK